DFAARSRLLLRVALEPRAERLAREAGEWPLAMDAQPVVHDLPRRPERPAEVHEHPQRPEAPRKAVEGADAAEDAVAEWQPVLAVALRHHLVLELGHVHAGGALRLAGLALHA